MIFNVADYKFRNIFQDPTFHLPIRWDGKDFLSTVNDLLDKYYAYVKKQFYVWQDNVLLREVRSVCRIIKTTIRNYLNGFPAKAYESFSKLMAKLVAQPLKVYQKTVYELFDTYNDKLRLFRVAKVAENKLCDRTRLFHAPYTMRSKISTNRYSIAGYPCLYLGTTLELCCEEINYSIGNGSALASRFQIVRSREICDSEINVIELAVKPQDFFPSDNSDFYERSYNRRYFDEINLNDASIRSAYLLWYPLIAVCSYMRVNKSDPFAAEYIMPQLLMQWVRDDMARKDGNSGDKLVGIRYFSCASEKASNMGFNYVFPVSGNQHSQSYPYCPILMRAFRLTVPKYVNEYYTVRECEYALINDVNLDYIDR